MKRFIAILLVLTMVLPLCVFANAADEKVTAKPFVMTNSEILSEEDAYDNFFGKIQFWSRNSDDYMTDDSMIVSVPGHGKEIKKIAENLKKTFEEYPEGTRYLRYTALRPVMLRHQENVIFFEKGIQICKEWFTEFITYYKSIGGKIDGVVADVEIFDVFSYDITQLAMKDQLLYKKIVDNPLYKTKIRPKLEERGFKFWPNVTDQTPEIYSIDQNSGAEYAQSRNIWDIVIRNHLNQYVNEAFLDSLLANYPDAVLCDYQARDTWSWLKTPTDKGSIPSGGNYYTAGNVNYFNTYAARPGTGFFKDNGVYVYKNLPSYNGAVWADNPFNMVLWEMINAKNLKASAPNGRFTATMTFYKYTSRTTSYCNNAYYSEIMYHMGMLNPDPFQSYCIESEIVSRNTDVNDAIKVISELLKELTRVAGYSDRKHVSMPYTWNDKYILTGMYANGRNIWRITPDTTGGMTLKDFKVEGAKDPTFSIAGQTITFPGGKIIEDSKISIVGTCGYWVETAKDVLPVITYSENRYEEYPAFIENYESYKANADFDFNLATPAGCYEVKKTKTSTAKIVAVDGNNALAFTGDYSLKLKEILKNITAGDTYAENQAWEVEVTVPANMAAEAEINALNVFGTKAKAEEGGFKIAGGKVYYDKAGEYVELEGVDVSAGGKFKLKRSVDFNNAEAFTSDYAVYDASGKLLGQVKDVPMVQVKIPVQKINLSVAGITGDAVLFDNFKLYANGVGADFELYNAKTGIEYTDLESAKDSNTAYRLSWMNATAYEKVYSVVAAYYNGDKLVEEKVVEEIKMAPGTDYVAYGVVEVKDGQTVKLYARNDSQPEPEDDTKPGTSNKPGATTEKGDDSTLLIIVIAVAVVLLAGIAVAVVLLTKKPAKKKKKSGKKTAKKAPQKTTKEAEKKATEEATEEVKKDETAE